MPVLLMSLFLTGCGTNNAADRLSGAKIAEETGKQLDRQTVIANNRVKEALRLPPYPASCSKTVNSNIKRGDRLDIALDKTDIALSSANNIIRRCANWYNSQRTQRNKLVNSL